MGNKANIAGAVITVVLPSFFGFMGKPTEMGISVVACAIALSFLNLNKIQRFKGAGFEAEMKKAVDEANATLVQLRKIAGTSTEATLTGLISSSFIAGVRMDVRLKLHDQLIENLKEIGVSESNIDEIDSHWRRGIGVIFHRAVRQTITDDPPTGADEVSIREASKKFQNLFDSETWTAPNPPEMRKFLNDNDLMNPSAEELLKDYEEYEKTGKFRRIRVFVEL